MDPLIRARRLPPLTSSDNSESRWAGGTGYPAAWRLAFTRPRTAAYGPYASTQLRWSRPLRPGALPYLFCVRAVSPVNPATGKRVESRPGRLKLTNSTSSTGGKWVVEKIDSYPIGSDRCPDAPAKF